MNRFNRGSNILQKTIPILPLMKMLFCGLNFLYWNNCPWAGPNESMNFLKSFRVTLATLFQTALSLFFVLNAIGFKISRQSITQ